jgi:hypothetical protein
MYTANRITVVLQSVANRDLSTLLPFLPVGQTVGLGKGEALVCAVAIGDQVAFAEQLRSQVVLAESALAKSKAMHKPWTDAQVLDFLSVAMRHVVIEGDLKYSDINTALKFMADKGRPAFVPQFNVDDHVLMARNAARYVFLRDTVSILSVIKELEEDASKSGRIFLREYYAGMALDLAVDAVMARDAQVEAERSA